MTAAPSSARLETAALDALAAGLCVIPPREDGSKMPLTQSVTFGALAALVGEERALDVLPDRKTGKTWKHWTIIPPDLSRVTEWYANGRAGLGTATGAPSGNLEAFEFDDGATYQTFKDTAHAAGLGELVERIAAGYSEATPGGGVHWLYRCSEIAGNSELARRPDPADSGKVKVLIETRGRGGFLILAPSHGRVHPNGKAYRLLRGSFATIATIDPEERAALWELARAFDEMPRSEAATSKAADRPPVSGDRPGDRFNAEADWRDILEPHGWRLVFERAGTGYWCRPGKDRGVSATTNWKGYNQFYPFTTSTSFDSERGYGPFSVYALLNHNGDFTEAARALAEAFKLKDTTASTGTDNGQPPAGDSRFARFSNIAKPEKRENGKPSRFVLTPLVSLLAEPPQEIDWLVDNMLPAGGISICAAKPKVGKSTTARSLAFAVARGESFLGRCTAKGPVVYLALEEKRSEVQKHFARMGAGDDPIFIHVGSAPEDALGALQAAIAEHTPVLAIIDPILKLIRLRDGNDYAEVSRAFEPLIDLARASGCHLMCLHHLGKGERTGGDAILGSTALFGAVDTAFLMKRRENARTAETIQRYGEEDLPETVLRLDPESGLVSAGGDVATMQLEEAGQKVLDAMGDDALSEADIRERVGGNTGLTGKAVRRLYDDGRLNRTGEGKKGAPYLYRVTATKKDDPPSGAVDEPPPTPPDDSDFPRFPRLSIEEKRENEKNGNGGVVLVCSACTAPAWCIDASDSTLYYCQEHAPEDGNRYRGIPDADGGRF